jgi:hypothetical protein
MVLNDTLSGLRTVHVFNATPTYHQNSLIIDEKMVIYAKFLV